MLFKVPIYAIIFPGRAYKGKYNIKNVGQVFSNYLICAIDQYICCPYF